MAVVLLRLAGRGLRMAVALFQIIMNVIILTHPATSHASLLKVARGGLNVVTQIRIVHHDVPKSLRQPDEHRADARCACLSLNRQHGGSKSN